MTANITAYSAISGRHDKRSPPRRHAHPKESEGGSLTQRQVSRKAESFGRSDSEILPSKFDTRWSMQSGVTQESTDLHTLTSGDQIQTRLAVRG